MRPAATSGNSVPNTWHRTADKYVFLRENQPCPGDFRPEVQ